ncbi:MAG: helix-turn-helix domain-containing protein [Gemmataceae bacterium]|nr:helix-turn-helix domain-containing protein [Gemmataceae bacterium]
MALEPNLTMAEIENILKVSDSTIERWIRKGWFPPGIPGGRKLTWLAKDVEYVQHMMGRGCWPPGRDEEDEKPEKK